MTTQKEGNEFTLDEGAFPRRADTHELEAGDTAPLEEVVGFRPTHIRDTNPLTAGQRRDPADLGGVWGRTASRGSRRDDHCK